MFLTTRKLGSHWSVLGHQRKQGKPGGRPFFKGFQKTSFFLLLLNNNKFDSLVSNMRGRGWHFRRKGVCYFPWIASLKGWGQAVITWCRRWWGRCHAGHWSRLEGGKCDGNLLLSWAQPSIKSSKTLLHQNSSLWKWRVCPESIIINPKVDD